MVSPARVTVKVREAVPELPSNTLGSSTVIVVSATRPGGVQPTAGYRLARKRWKRIHSIQNSLLELRGLSLGM